MGKRELEMDAIRLYADGMEIPEISKQSKDEGWYVSENTLRKWKGRAGTEWDDARRSARQSQLASMEDVGSRLRRSREIASQMMGSVKDQSAVGMVLNQGLQTMVYDLMGQIQTTGITDADAAVDMVNRLSLAIARSEQAAARNQKTAAEIKRQTIEAAVGEVKKKATDGTFQFDPEAVEYIAGALYGLKI